MDLPPDDCVEFLRGVKDDKEFDGEGFDHSIFSSDIHDLDRDELIDWQGTSINWDLKNGDALGQLLKLTDERKNNEIKFKFGAIRIPREKLDAYAKRYHNKLAYEHHIENGNDYHGHILFSKTLERSRRQTICAFLANDFILIHRQENNND
jgi:hypothetical protein